jgi:hypothetical protein
MSDPEFSIEWHTAADREALLARWKAEIEAERERLAECYRLPLADVRGPIIEAILQLQRILRELTALQVYDQRLMRRLVAVREGTRHEDGSPVE